ncbi:ThiF family adenylyltransferase [Anoxynatronum buryatiense]|uniref:Molybdopterin or thiamine biosynthesis adenylyltransferase n=1 Tax=Anoxynatronum buryatiense TaxID=489973 RepID=A0AA45WUI2_9CLOT|nr:ThiF family adenylyltransferase [Anoxynatronum buryatiense]SMP48144.1 Molybdopterin or thiamine biosynthesis adenylyltransferase [Anoxynatronum buryatiense]
MLADYQHYFNRNIGIFTENEQKRLQQITIGIAGAGGVGGLLAERFIRLGVGCIKICDPGSFEPSNINRQYGATCHTMNDNKAAVIQKILCEINPDASIHSDQNGITDVASAVSFVEGCDLVIDEMDYGAWKESIFLQRAARSKGIYYLFAGAIGFGALVSSFDPQGITLEEYNGLNPDQDLDNLTSGSITSERVMPVIPSYAERAMTKDMLKEVVDGHRPVPTCSIGVGMAALLAASESINIILKRREPVRAPQYLYTDLLDHQMHVGNMDHNNGS